LINNIAVLDTYFAYLIFIYLLLASGSGRREGLMDDQLFYIVDAIVHVTIRKREDALSNLNPEDAQPGHGGEVRGGGSRRVWSCR
jgi:hypothetical protein